MEVQRRLHHTHPTNTFVHSLTDKTPCHLLIVVLKELPVAVERTGLLDTSEFAAILPTAQLPKNAVPELMHHLGSVEGSDAFFTQYLSNMSVEHDTKF